MSRESGLTNRIVLAILATALASASACSSPVSPSVRQVAGAWVVNSTLAAASGGDCVGDTLQATMSSRDTFFTALKQDGIALEATVTSTGSGTRCAYSGALGNSLDLSLASCSSDRVAGVQCTNGALRDVQIISGSIVAAVDGRTSGPGTETSAWNVFLPGGSAPVAMLRLRATSTWNFLGVPSSDYHVFTGTIFPGYADGTISIEGIDPFCLPCGWFPR